MEEVKKRISQLMFFGFFSSIIIGVLVNYQTYGFAAFLFCCFLFCTLIVLLGIVLLGIVAYKE